MTKEKKNEKKRDGLNGVLMQVAISIISIVFAFLVGGIIIAAMGENPFKAYSVLIKGAVGTPVALTVSLTKTVPLILTGLAVCSISEPRVSFWWGPLPPVTSASPFICRRLFTFCSVWRPPCLQACSGRLLQRF